MNVVETLGIQPNQIMPAFIVGSMLLYLANKFMIKELRNSLKNPCRKRAGQGFYCCMARVIVYLKYNISSKELV